MSVPTIVLVHGNFLGPWSWSDVAAKLQDTGMRTVMPDLPSADPRCQPRGDLHADAAAVRQVLDLLQPPVLLCGHSYGGAVITEAAAGPHPAVRHLVYLAGAVPDEGDSLTGLTPEPPQGVREQAAVRETGGEAVTIRADGMIELKPGSALGALFHDCEPERAQAAINQLRPSNPATGTQSVTGAAWRDVPATFVRCRDDRMPELVSARFSGPSVERVELPTGHCPNWSHPDLVADVLNGIAKRISA